MVRNMWRGCGEEHVEGVCGGGVVRNMWRGCGEEHMEGVW